MGMKLAWPMFALADQTGASLGYVCIQGPAANSDQLATMLSFSAAHRLIGFCSYMDFPAAYRLPDRRDYESLCFAWCHCFRQPGAYFAHTERLLLLSYSDFIDYARAAPRRLLGREHVVKRQDFVYVCQAGHWKEEVKNWELARRCLPVLCDRLGLEGVLVGRTAIEGPVPGGVTVLPELPWEELMRLIASARFLFLPNERDASPRLLCEALCMDTPVLVNRKILGGWKYITPFTGAFFDDEHNLAPGIRCCLGTRVNPRRWYIANSGPLVSGRRLARFLAAHDPRLAGLSWVQFTDTM
jgi:hypothetical protein